MKKIIKTLVISIILLYVNLVNAQWFQQNSGTINNLNSVFCASPDTVYACGKNGTILRTIDGGSSWDILNSGINKMLNSISFVNKEVGFVGGDDIILKTIDHGENWFIVYIDTIPATPNFYSTFFLNADTGFVVGYNPIFKTIDGGNNWMQYSVPPQFYYTALISVFFSTDKIGYAVGVFHQISYDEGVIVKTIDGGNNWFMLSQLGTFINKSFQSVFFIDSLKGWMGGGYFGNSFNPNYRNLFKSIDGGITWDTLTTPFQNAINSIFFTNDHTGYIADDTGHIYNSINDGAIWQLQAFFPNISIKSIYCIDSSICYAVGDSGLILKTINGGVTIINEFENKNSFQVYPNPINNIATIQYSLQRSIKVNLFIKDIFGRKIKDLVSQTLQTGSHQLNFDATNFSPGIYFCTMETYDFRNTIKIIIIK